jgi:hypothetical protein
MGGNVKSVGGGDPFGVLGEQEMGLGGSSTGKTLVVAVGSLLTGDRG